ncbi:MAG: bifunctional diaminohydroxyphosphoribosylaminopyrimidine deaminase/5-amino-6-(5-phosphoribosylamino)uracil reductase RibD [Terriglobales bacterium]
MPLSSNDERYMARALELARQGVGLASPNPCVGAIVVDAHGDIIGRGIHSYAGLRHAEVLALEEAGAAARGATLYLNLEPCCHLGRTGPCTDAVIAAGVRRVVAAMADPNPLVAGQGVARLRAAGVEVTTGVGEQEARKLNEAFAKYIRTRRPLVTLKSAMTLDGKIAMRGGSPPPSQAGASGDSATWITGEAARAHVQQLRHASDAILVGVGTVIADNPRLTDRTALARRRPLLRVIMDSRLRIPLESGIVQTANNDVLVFHTSGESEKRKELEKRGVCLEQVRPDSAGRADFNEVVARLGEMELISLLIEGGAAVNGAALASGIVDKIFFYYAPKVLGVNAVPVVTGTGWDCISEAVQVNSITLHRFGEDFAAEGYIRDPYEIQQQATGS